MVDYTHAGTVEYLFLEETGEFLDGSFVIIHPNINEAIIEAGIATLVAHNQQGGRLLAALVAALAVTTSVYAADATYPSDDTICPLLHEHIECRANGDCGPYNYTGRDGFWDLYDAAKPSTLSNATQTCYGLTNATSCDGNSLRHWIYGWCALKHTEVYDLISADGAPASAVTGPREYQRMARWVNQSDVTPWRPE